MGGLFGSQAVSLVCQFVVCLSTGLMSNWMGGKVVDCQVSLEAGWVISRLGDWLVSRLAGH